ERKRKSKTGGNEKSAAHAREASTRAAPLPGGNLGQPRLFPDEHMHNWPDGHARHPAALPRPDHPDARRLRRREQGEFRQLDGRTAPSPGGGAALTLPQRDATSWTKRLVRGEPLQAPGGFRLTKPAPGGAMPARGANRPLFSRLSHGWI